MINTNFEMPKDHESEQAVLGSVISKNSELNLIRSIIKHPSYFYNSTHRAIFSAMIDLCDNGEPIEEISLFNKLRGNQHVSKSGGLSYITELYDCVSSSGNTSFYCRIIAECYLKRIIIEYTECIKKKAFDQKSKTKDIIDNALELFGKLRNTLSVNARAVRVFDEMPTVINEINLVADGKKEIGIISGYDDIDRMLGGGAQNGDLIFIGAEASTGKTSLAMCLGMSFANRAKKGLIISLESSRDSLIKTRIIPSSLSIDSRMIRSGKMTQDEWDKLIDFAQEKSLKNLKICDESTMNINDIYSLVSAEHETDGIDFLMVDFTQLITPVNYTGNRNNDLGTSGRGLKKITKDFNIPVFALSQITGDKLRDSGELSHVSDVTIIMKKMNEVGMINCQFHKNRNGIKGDCPMLFIPEFTQFKSVESSCDNYQYTPQQHQF